MALSFKPQEQLKQGERGDGVVVAYRESVLERMLGIHRYIDDRRSGHTSVMGRLRRMKSDAEQAGNYYAADSISETMTYFKEIHDEVAQISTEFAQIIQHRQTE